MSHCQKVSLDDRAVIRLSGPDAAKFLQGLVTNDVRRLGAETGLYAALLTPQGKMLFDFFVVSDGGGGFLVDCHAEQAEALIKRLGLYRLRAAVEIAPAPALAVAALLGEAETAPKVLPEGARGFPDPRLAALGMRVVLPSAGLSDLACAAADRSVYEALRIRNGIPEGGLDFAFGETFPHEALLDQLHGVDFDKGCFVGQEVVSRMQHRGTARKRVVPVTAKRLLPETGAAVEADGTVLGTLGSVSGRNGLAMIRLDRAAEALARGATLRAGDVPIRLEQPDWARFAVPTVPIPV
jgi:tRNA-modifying protein YgfZ